MPGVTRYITDPDATDRAKTLQEDAFRAELRVRTQRIEANWKQYKGKHRQHLQDDGTNTDDNVVFNISGLAVDKGVSDLVATTDEGVVEGPKFDIVGDEQPRRPNIIQRMSSAFRPATPKSPEQLWLDAAWSANNKELFLLDTALTSGVTGHNFVKVIPDALPNPDDPANPLPRLVLLNPCHVTAFWDDGDKAIILAYRIQYGPDRNQRRQDIVWEADRETLDKYGNVVDKGRWVIYDYEQVNRVKWTLVNKAENPHIWEYAWSPIVQWKNLPDPNDFYGCEDVTEPNVKLNDSLNFTASNIQRIIKYHADPKTVGTGVKADEVFATAVDRFIAIPNEAAKVFNLEMMSDLASSMNFAHMVRRGFFDGVRELDPATVEDRLGDMTNFGIRVLYGDKIKKTGSKRMMAGMGLTDINQRILDIGGFGPNRKVAIKWPAALPSDPLVQTQSLDMDTKHGLSQESYLSLRGYDSELEAARRENDIAEGTLRDTVARQGALVDNLRNGNGTNGGNGNARL
jgi:hypothetical protein